MEPIYILISTPGERHEDSTPEYFVTLDHLQETLDTIKSGLNPKYHDCEEYYVFVMKPNCPPRGYISDCDFELTIYNSKISINGKSKTMEYLISLIKKTFATKYK